MLFPRLTPPDRPNLKDLHTLAGDAKGYVEFRPNVRSRPSPFDEGTHHLLNPRRLTLRKRNASDA